MKLWKKILIICLLIADLQLVKAQTLSDLPSTVLWKISGDGIQQPSYIYLTNVGCDFQIKLNKSVEKSLENVKVIAVESNLNSKANATKIPQLIAATNDSQRIKNIMPTKEYSQMIRVVKDNYGMTEQYLNQFKPRYISSLLSMTANPCIAPGAERIEDVLNDYANKKGIEYKEMLTPEEVFSECDKYNKQYWQQNFLYLFNNADQIKLILQNRNDLYNDENMKGLKNLFSTSLYLKLKYSDSIVKIHNQLLASKIANIIRSQPALIAVDIAYWVTNDNSLPQLLRKAGYNINPVME